MSQHRYDSLIFDMDGTLWDAVDSYCAVWNETYRRLGIDHHISRPELLKCMGMPLEAIYRAIGTPDIISLKEYMAVLRPCEAEMMPTLGGRLYPGVREGLERLHDAGFRLFMVSNCSPIGLPNFMRYTGLGPLFTDYLSYGLTGQEKPANILALIKRYTLKSSCYIGDIEADCRDAHSAGIDMMWVSYGFGHCDDARLTASSFDEVTATFLPLLLQKS